MRSGQIVLVDWRDALPGSGEPNKRRPGVVVGSSSFFGTGLPFEIVVPLTGEKQLTIPDASLLILPTKENGCTKACYALSWCVQTMPHLRITETASRISEDELLQIRSQVCNCVTNGA